MANCHDLEVDGWMPFDILRDERTHSVMAQFASPSWGFRIEYGRTKLVPNEHGGRTTYYRFEIRGVEAMWASRIARMLAVLADAGAEIDRARARDLDYPTDWFVLDFAKERAT